MFCAVCASPVSCVMAVWAQLGLAGSMLSRKERNWPEEVAPAVGAAALFGPGAADAGTADVAGAAPAVAAARLPTAAGGRGESDGAASCDMPEAGIGLPAAAASMACSSSEAEDPAAAAAAVLARGDGAMCMAAADSGVTGVSGMMPGVLGASAGDMGCDPGCECEDPSSGEMADL